MVKTIYKFIDEYLRAKKVQFFESCIQFSQVDEIQIESNEITRISSYNRKEILIRICKDEISCSTLLSSFDIKTIKSKIDECCEMLNNTDTRGINVLLKKKKEIALFSNCDSDISLEKVIEITNQSLSLFKASFSNILITNMLIPKSKISILYFDSIGTNLFHDYSRIDYFIEFISKNDNNHNTYYYDYCTYSLTPNSNILDYGDVKFWMECANLDCCELEDIYGKSIILSPKAVEDILVNIIFTLCDESIILNNNSLWNDSLGKQIADKKLSIKIDPYNMYVVNGERITDYGTISKPYYLIKAGILCQFIYSFEGANKTGNVAVQNTSDCVIFDLGNKSSEALLSRIYDGILIGRFSSNGLSNSGAFSGLAKNCFKIENGKIKNRIPDLRITGSISEILNSILEISSNFDKNGYNVIPWIQIENGIYINF